MGNGQYLFTDTPVYPLHLSGGTLQGTNAVFDVNLSAQEGSIISPITTFLADDTTLLSALAGAGLGASTLEEFSVDYIDANNSTLAKLSQVLYVMLKDEALTSALKTRLGASTPASFDELVSFCEADINASATLDFKEKHFSRQLLQSIKAYTGAPSAFEAQLKNLKKNLNGDYADHARVVLKTGQVNSYAQDGTQVNDGSLKDDGFYQKGVTRSYTRTGNMVTDNATGLIWQDDANVSSVQKQWLSDANYATCSNDTTSPSCLDTTGDTATTYCENLTLGGFSDWRLPTSDELATIVDFSKRNPSVDTTVFTHTVSSHYWSSTSLEAIEDVAWGVNFRYGNDSNYFKDFNYYVRCVRDGQ